MPQNTSAERQNTLLTRVLQLFQYRSSEQARLETEWRSLSESLRQDFAERWRDASQALSHQVSRLEQEQTDGLKLARQQYETQTLAVANELEDKLSAARNIAKSARSDGEYDWFLSKQRLQKEFDADKVQIREAYKRQKGQLKQHGQDFTQLAAETRAVLQQHGCELKVQGGDLLEYPGDGQHLEAHLETAAQITELIRQFRKVFWVRFREEHYSLIVFMLAAVASAWPLHLWLGSAVWTGVGAACVAFLSSLAAWFVSRSFAKRSAHQFRDAFVSSIVAGKEKLLAAQHQNQKSRDARLKTLAEQYEQTIAQLDVDWQSRQEEIRCELQRRENELADWSHQRNETLKLQLKNQEDTLASTYRPQIDAAQQQLLSARTDLQQQESNQLADARADYDQKLQTLIDTWKNGFEETRQELARSVEEAAVSRLDYANVLTSDQLPTEPLTLVQLGELNVDLAALPNSLPADCSMSVDATRLQFPVALDLVNAPSLLVESSTAGRSQAKAVLRLAMLRLLTSIPAGKLRFTIVDPVGLGQDFSAFMHLADHDEQLVNHRIWTESAHINTRLTELTQHMENVIQTYLRNEFDSIQDYNRHAGEVAEAFRVLVVANFPSGFSDEAAARLLSIVSSGPRCGVYTILSMDPGQALPRNFDVEELRNNTNVLITDGADVRWSSSPLSDFPLQLDALPAELGFSQIMHCVGEQAKGANRVEVPFSAVAPAEADWWQGDSRSEISVPLGRAGATKLQSMQLGHGTSQHVLISGKTGSGKSTLLHALITNLALKYSPDEVQFYLIDFKKGVEFKAYAEQRLPHARVIAIESEREFGQSVLQRLDQELRRRGDLFRRVGVQSLAGYRDSRPDERMPRILLVIDEFQEFFVKEDKIAQEASLLLDRLVRQGRAFGIHVLLGSQTLAGSYSLARATIGQMAVRIALQCSAGDAHLILSDDNDAARLLRRPGEAIYNDANGMVEGNHPFQVVWLTDLEREHYLRQIAERYARVRAAATSRHRSSEDEVTSSDVDRFSRHDDQADSPIVFEGNVAASLSNNQQLRKSWAAPAPTDVPLAPRAWLGEAIAIKEAPAVVFHRRSGANLMLVGQREEEALGIMASGLLSLAAFSPQDAEQKTRFVVLDGTRPESNEAGYWNRLRETTGIDVQIVKPRDAVEAIASLSDEVARRGDHDEDAGRATFLFIYNLSRFRELQKSDDDFGFGKFGEGQTASPAEQLSGILRDGPMRGVHTLLWSDTHTNLMRWIDRQSLRDIEARVLFQMSATDSSNLMDSSAAANLGQFRAILYSEDQGRAERFRPYGLPDDDFLLSIRSMHTSPARGRHPSA